MKNKIISLLALCLTIFSASASENKFPDLSLVGSPFGSLQPYQSFIPFMGNPYPTFTLLGDSTPFISFLVQRRDRDKAYLRESVNEQEGLEDHSYSSKEIFPAGQEERELRRLLDKMGR